MDADNPLYEDKRKELENMLVFWAPPGFRRYNM